MFFFTSFNKKLTKLNSFDLSQNLNYIFFEGNKYNISIQHSSITPDTLMIVDNTIIIYVPINLSKTVKYAYASTTLKLWLKSNFRQKVLQLVNKYTKQLNVHYSKVKISQNSSNWGSCSMTTKAISINFSLVAAPLEILEYVVIHEVCHLVHSNHSKDFWNLVAAIMPNYKMHSNWLKTKVP